ncbi:MAG: hypothetical protein CMG64_01105 [Candidatus Marinimicrobia bacterium]|nr:hypothetical protein [Candidatus Neomarinimicrobiota bacterium]|tara:strand:- start:11367 stop:12560 length:1194 start_codon:yes stop_codon:yes gene_type:complete
MKLEELVKKYGTPDILIDNYSFPNKGYAIWNYKDSLIFNASGLIRNNQYIDDEPLFALDKAIEDWNTTSRNISSIGYTSYSMKNYLFPHIKFKNQKQTMPYFWFVQPDEIFTYDLNSFNDIELNKILSLKQDLLLLDEYIEKIKIIKQHLYDGNVYQINFTMQKILDYHEDPFSLYLMIRSIAKPKFGYYINTGESHILSFSPESFFTVQDGIIKTHPMKGTRSRSKDNLIDKKLKKELFDSDKDKAEHLMIVDLMRNDLGKICKYGSVNVDDLFTVNSYETVHQMVSCISGKLNHNIKYSDILKALFPGGSITGAPKESAMKIIDNLENYNRELYTGTIGYITKDSMNFNIAIRTLYMQNNIIKYSVGGGIVWDSNAQDELLEAELKSKILDRVII